MFKIFLFTIFIITKVKCYDYIYESEDLLKESASTNPSEGYRVIQRSFYPNYYPNYFNNYYNGYNQPYYNGISGLAPLRNYYPQYIGETKRGDFSDDHRAINDGKYEKVLANKGEELNHGNEGFSHGKIALSGAKKDASFYNDEHGAKKIVEDGKSFNTGQHYQQNGKTADENQAKSGHKKGHVIKGFKTSHHKDESGKTEEYFDEANDEGGDVKYNGRAGNFAKNSQIALKGGHENALHNLDQRKQQGFFDSKHVIDNSKANQGHFDQKKYHESGENYGLNSGINQHALLGHQENNQFYKSSPYHVPFY